MSAGAATWLVVAVALLAANLPFVNERLFVVGPRRAPKAFGWRLLELVVAGGLTLLLGSALEASLGQRAPQGWEFYAAWTCLMLTLASPGFVWRYLRRGASAAAHE
ncbi:DUF2818 family protein [Ideonella sp. 4Y16]|uniref:DUF2818 family protein n=1 Tax=Ideonella alba TaxID=2824118 RepID=A0A941BEQ6_9BURK|nr:DUF2818 family protein [Ideonella alba]MBQ0931351.1 DUF2818 family protein [Ideonella alba]MBQ0945061.1 DUF2818 family protein [Ideonella alba]